MNSKHSFYSSRTNKPSRSELRKTNHDLTVKSKRPEKPLDLTIPQGNHFILPLLCLLGGAASVAGSMRNSSPGANTTPGPQSEYRHSNTQHSTHHSQADTALKEMVQQSFCSSVSPTQQKALTDSFMAMSPEHKKNAAACLLGPKLKEENKCIINVREERPNGSLAKASATRNTDKKETATHFTASRSASIINIYQNTYSWNEKDLHILRSDLEHEIQHCVDHLGAFSPLKLSRAEIESHSKDISKQNQYIQERLNEYAFKTFNDPEETTKYKKLYSGFVDRIGSRLSHSENDTRDYFKNIGLTALEHYNESTALFDRIKEGWAKDKIKGMREKLLREEALDSKETAEVGRWIANVVTKAYDQGIMQAGHGMVGEVVAYLNSICPELRKAVDVKMNKFVTELRDMLLDRVLNQFSPDIREKYNRMTNQNSPASDMTDASTNKIGKDTEIF